MTEEMNVDDIMRRIKEEVALRRTSISETDELAFRGNDMSEEELFHSEIRETQVWRVLKKIQQGLRGFAFYAFVHRFALKAKGRIPKYRNLFPLTYFMQYDDDEFVRKAYQAILMRGPDPQGLQQYAEKLRGGQLSKSEILGRLRYSREGRRQNVKVPGLFLRTCVNALRRIPIVGRRERS